MVIPEIKINNKLIKADENIKMKTWREYLKISSEQIDDSLADLMERAIKVICVVFNHEDVTKENIDEYVNVSEIIPTFKACNEFMQTLTFAKLKDDNEKNVGKA